MLSCISGSVSHFTSGIRYHPLQSSLDRQITSSIRRAILKSLGVFVGGLLPLFSRPSLGQFASNSNIR